MEEEREEGRRRRRRRGREEEEEEEEEEKEEEEEEDNDGEKISVYWMMERFTAVAPPHERARQTAAACLHPWPPAGEPRHPRAA